MTTAAHKAKRLILHAGLPKTATTSVQNAIFSRRDILLSEAGYLYPGAEANHTNALCTAFLDDPRQHIANKVAGRTDLGQLAEMARSIRDAFAAEICEKQPETILFSAEGMSNLSNRELEKFRDWALDYAEQIDVLYVVRNPLRYSASVIQQHLKGGDVLEDMYEDPPLANFKGRISNAIAAFGRERISIRPFEDMIAHADGVAGYFLDSVGVSSGPAYEAIVEAQVVENESLSHEAALTLSSLNRLRPAFTNGQRSQRRTFNELGLIESIRGVKFYLPDEVRSKIAERSQVDVDWLKENFGLDIYDNAMKVEAQESKPTLSANSIDSIAILLSNLINDRHVNTLMQKAIMERNQGKRDNLKYLASEIRRISPQRKLPPFLAELVEE